MSIYPIPSCDPNHFDPLLADPDMQDDINASMGLQPVEPPDQDEPDNVAAWMDDFINWLCMFDDMIDYDAQPAL